LRHHSPRSLASLSSPRPLAPLSAPTGSRLSDLDVSRQVLVGPRLRVWLLSSQADMVDRNRQLMKMRAAAFVVSVACWVLGWFRRRPGVIGGANMGGQGLDDGIASQAGQGNVAGGQGATGGAARAAMRWTPVMSGFVLRRFVELVGTGVKTDKGFKEVHVNSVARNLTEFTGQEDHPKDAEFLNVPIENYVQMQIIFEAGQATGRFAMANVPGGSSAGGSAVGASASGTQGTKSSDDPVNLGKRRRSLTDEEVGIMTGLTGAVVQVAEAFRAPVRVQNSDVHPYLYQACMGTVGFSEADLMTALTYLLDNKRQGEGFVLMSEAHRVLWLRQFLAKLTTRDGVETDSE
ncbi:hypothetical protein EJB05_55916, partial [Eragrostis curvula]